MFVQREPRILAPPPHGDSAGAAAGYRTFSLAIKHSLCWRSAVIKNRT
jgi:hypothetical protein